MQTVACQRGMADLECLIHTDLHQERIKVKGVIVQHDPSGVSDHLKYTTCHHTRHISIRLIHDALPDVDEK